MHPLEELLIGALRLGVGFYHFIAIGLTISERLSSLEYFSVALLFVFQTFKGLGYDVIEKHYGFEASIYSDLFIALKVAPYINSLDILWYWLPVVGLEIIFQLLRHIPPGKDGYTSPLQRVAFFLDYYRYNDEQLYDAKHTPSFYKSGSEDNPVPLWTWYGTGVMMGLVALYNLLRGLMLYYNVWVSGVYANDSTEAEWAILIEGVLALWFVLRMHSMTPHYYTQHSDYFTGIGGLYMLYIYYQFSIVVASTDSQLIIMIIMIIVMFGGALFTYRYNLHANVAHESDVGYIYQLTEILRRGLYDLFKLMTSEPTLQIYYIIFCAYLGISATSRWYTTIVGFDNAYIQFNGLVISLKGAGCLIQGFVDNWVQKFFNLGNFFPDDITDALNIIFDFLFSLRWTLFGLTRLSYPTIYQACNGAIAFVTPTEDPMIALAVIIPWLPAFVMMLQFFPVATMMIEHPYFWISAASLNAGSLITLQVYADLKATFWYIFITGTTYSRTYTDTGSGATTVGVILILIPCLMAYYRQKATKNQRLLKLSSKTDVAAEVEARSINDSTLTKVKNSPVAVHTLTIIENITKFLFNIRLWLYTIGLAILIFAIQHGSPFTNVGFHSLPSLLPPWLVMTKKSQYAAAFLSLASVLSNKIKIPLGALYLAKAVLTSFWDPCASLFGYTICLSDITGGIINKVLDALNGAVDLIVPPIANVIASLNIPIISDLVGFLNGFLGQCVQFINTMYNMNWFNINVSFFRYPSSLLYILIGILIVVVICGLFVAIYIDFQWLDRLINAAIFCLISSTFTGVLYIFQTIKGFDVAMDLEFSDIAPIYAIGALLLILGTIYGFFDQFNNDRATESKSAIRRFNYSHQQKQKPSNKKKVINNLLTPEEEDAGLLQYFIK